MSRITGWRRLIPRWLRQWWCGGLRGNDHCFAVHSATWRPPPVSGRLETRCVVCGKPRVFTLVSGEPTPPQGGQPCGLCLTPGCRGGCNHD
jgi:hypothetical protein